MAMYRPFIVQSSTKIKNSGNLILCLQQSKINGNYPQRCLYLPISKLHSILAETNLLAHNNITISYYVQVNSQRLKSTVASKWASKHLCGTNYFAFDGTSVLIALIIIVHTVSLAE